MASAEIARRAEHRALLAWSAAHVLAALTVAIAAAPAFTDLVYAGAGYTAIYGLMQIAVALRLRPVEVSSRADAPDVVRSAVPRTRSP